jgi:hypothetical protein
MGERKVSIHLECDTNSYLDEKTITCMPCPPGTVARNQKLAGAVTQTAGAKRCVPCDPGFNRSGHHPACMPCPRGTSAPSPGTDQCAPCALGTYAPLPGAAACLACPAGTRAPAPGAHECEDCGPRHFGPVPGLATCLRCPNRTVTRSMQSTSINQCECAGGSYHKLARIGEECEECPRGMYCQGALVPPVQRTSFWSAAEIYPDPVTVISTVCSYRGVRGVCIGYPHVQNQTLLQLCLYHPQERWCSRERAPALDIAVTRSWPNLTGLPGDQQGGRNEFMYAYYPHLQLLSCFCRLSPNKAFT